MKVWIPSKPHSNLQETLDLICYDILPPERQEPAREVVERSGATPQIGHKKLETLKEVARKTTGLKISLSPLTMAAAVLSQLRIDSHRTKGGEGALLLSINKSST